MSLSDELKGIVGERGWTNDPGELAPHLSEWRDSVFGKSGMMISPASTDEVSRVVGVCARYGTGIVPQGGNTGLCGGAIPDQSGAQVLLSMSRMNRVRNVDADDYSMIAEAGCVLATIQDKASAANRFFPLSLSAQGSCQIGGNLSTNAGGINVLRYGTARDQVLGLEVVLANGDVWNGLRTLRKDNAGYDLKQLFVGSEGTLGIITAAALKLYPAPGVVQTVFVALTNARCAVTLLAFLRERHGDRLQAFELMSDRAIDFVERHVPGTRQPFNEVPKWTVLFDLADSPDTGRLQQSLEDAITSGFISDGVIAKNGVEADDFWRIRHALSAAQKQEGASLKHDVSVPVARVGEFLEAGQALVESMLPAARLVAFGHVGDGNLHFNVSQPVAADPGAFREQGKVLSNSVYELVDRLGGSFSAEHGVGVAKKALLAKYRGGVDLQLMRTLKNALDPDNILNPGKVI